MNSKINNDFTKNITNISLLESKAYDAKLLVDPFSEMMLFGTTIDFINEDFNKGIFENKFIFRPDKDIVNACGCGVSFPLKK